MKKYEKVLNDVLKKIKPSSKEVKDISLSVKKFVDILKKEIKIQKIDAEIFIGGSFAKNTAIKKGEYDVDLFIRYGKKHAYEDFSLLTSRLLKSFKDPIRIHGSRDYFRIKEAQNFFIEIIPVKRIRKPFEAENITDFSYSHVKYIKKKIKNKKILDEIKIAKAFCYASECYGAESYIRGFSGYGLELLVFHYKSFFNFVKAIANSKERIIIDMEKAYPNKKRILLDLNSSKLSSPIILIDPTCKQRNVLAALSQETFERFRKKCKDFIKKPEIEAFEEKKQNIEEIKKIAEKNKENFVCFELITSKQEGDIAGSKLLKFFNHLKKETEKRFKIQKEAFIYEGNKKANVFLSVKPKEKIIISGPSIEDKKNVLAFKKRHKEVSIKKGRFYSEDKFEVNIKKFLEKWIKKNEEKIRDMSIDQVKNI